MREFFRFPHTPHLLWLGKSLPRDDKVMTPDEAQRFLSGEVIVEEKIDGANVGISVDEDLTIRVQNRGQYLSPAHPAGQFRTLFAWLQPRHDRIVDSLFPNLMLFGEWCYAVHSVRYLGLPDWFLAFDVYDREKGAFWSVERRNELAAALDIATVPLLHRGTASVQELLGLMTRSRFTQGPADGIYLRREEQDWLAGRAKLVRQDFIQNIDQHWSRRALERNALQRRS